MAFTELPIGMKLYALFVTGLFGLVMGSFCNAWAWRIANGEKISHGRSHCTSCGHTLAAKDLVPLFSWLLLKGKCRYCGAKIPGRYPLTEAILAAYYVSIAATYGFSWDTPRFLILGSLAFTASLVDWDTMELPDGLQIAMAVTALFRLLSDKNDWKDMLFGAAIAIPLLIIVLVSDKIKGRETMGGGDIKLIAVFGLHFGIWKILLLIIAACVFGLLGAAITRTGKGKEFPFGPAISLAAWFTALFGSFLINAYVSLF